jgi:hypothetical protein
MLDSLILITKEEKWINIEHAKMFELMSTGMAIIDSTLYRAKKYEEELATMLKDLDHLCHLVKYYQHSTQATMFLRSEFQDSYRKFHK